MVGGYRTHTVRAGETLWDIAHTYLGDGDLWPDLIRFNHIKDPHWIYPNEVLRIPKAPGGGPADAIAAAAAPQPTPAPDPAEPVAPAKQDTQAAPPPSAPAATDVAQAPDTNPEPSAPASSEDVGEPTSGPTLFNHPPETRALFAAERGSALVRVNRTGVHPGEHYAAPYLDRDGGPEHAGEVVGVSDVSSVILPADREHFNLDEEIYLTMPRGSAPEVGARFMTYQLGESLGPQGQIVIPTGIVTVVRPGTKNLATIARITTLYGEVRLGQGVLPLDQAVLPTGMASAVEHGPETHVVWVEHNQVLPTMQHYVVLAASEKQGIHLGDQLTLYQPRERLPESSIVLPSTDIAVGQIVRVTPWGSTALIIAQDQPAIHAGNAARVTARGQ
jgi:LysM repeat protein